MSYIAHNNYQCGHKAGETSSRTARVVDNQHDVDAVDLDEFHEKDAVADRVEAHQLHVLRRELPVLRLRRLHQRLEDAVVQIREKPA